MKHGTVKYIALLRGINVGGVRIPMPDLRKLCERLGWSDVQTYIQSGNVIFAAGGTRASLEKQLEDGIKQTFGYSIPVAIRDGAAWRRYIKANPFLKACETRPNLVMLATSKTPPAAQAAEELQARAKNGERVTEAGGTLWVHFPEGSARSKLTPSLLDRLAGSPVTLRNWRTVLTLDELVRKTPGQ